MEENDTTPGPAYHCGHEDPERALPEGAAPAAVEFELDGSGEVVRYVRASAGSAARFHHGGVPGPGGRPGWHFGGSGGALCPAYNDPLLSDYAWLAESATRNVVMRNGPMRLTLVGTAASLRVSGSVITDSTVGGNSDPRFVCVDAFAADFADGFLAREAAPVAGAASDVPALKAYAGSLCAVAAAADRAWRTARKWRDSHGS